MNEDLERAEREEDEKYYLDYSQVSSRSGIDFQLNCNAELEREYKNRQFQQQMPAEAKEESFENDRRVKRSISDVSIRDRKLSPYSQSGLSMQHSEVNLNINTIQR